MEETDNKGEIVKMDKLEKLIELHFDGQVKMDLSEKIEKSNYYIRTSKLIDDYYWNYAFLKSTDVDLKSVWKDIKSDM